MICTPVSAKQIRTKKMGLKKDQESDWASGSRLLRSPIAASRFCRSYPPRCHSCWRRWRSPLPNPSSAEKRTADRSRTPIRPWRSPARSRRGRWGRASLGRRLRSKTAPCPGALPSTPHWRCSGCSCSSPGCGIPPSRRSSSGGNQPGPRPSPQAFSSWGSSRSSPQGLGLGLGLGLEQEKDRHRS